MVKCREYKIPGFEHPVFVHHNEDWSGMAVIEWWDERFRRVEIPARVLLLVSFTETKTWVLSELESALDKQIQSTPMIKKGKRS